MADETVEQKLARYEYVLGAQMTEITRLREENERLSSAQGAHATLKSIYADSNQPAGLRIKAAAASLPHEVPKLQSVPPAIDATCEEIIPLSELVEKQRKRADAMLRDWHDIEVSPSGAVRILPKPGSNGSGD